MAINLKNTDYVSVNGVKMLVYGEAGVGKTTLIRTLPSPIILSSEAGLLSLQGTGLPYLEIGSYDDLVEAYNWLYGSDEAKQFASVALDSISEIGEVVLHSKRYKTDARGNTVENDVRRAYGDMQDAMATIIRSFRDLPGKHVYFTAKVERATDEMGRIMYAPSMPGNKMSQMLPYFFDEILALRVATTDAGTVARYLQATPDGIWQAKDRSGKLDAAERPNLAEIIAKISGGNTSKNLGGNANASDQNNR